jgi:hypothetical protein
METTGNDATTAPLIEEVVCNAFRIPTLRPSQLKYAVDIVNGKDVFLAVVTGQGRTTVVLEGLIVAQHRREKGCLLRKS